MKTLLALVISFVSLTVFAQDVPEREVVPVEVRDPTPGSLEGHWVLRSGVGKANKEKSKEIFKPKPAPGTELSRDSVTTTEVVNGVTITRTETEIKKIVEPAGNPITPQQKEKKHKPLPPSISFFGANQTFTGFSGCNKFAGRYSLDGNKLTIEAVNPSTRMECIGDYDEKEFFNKLNQVNAYRVNGGRLHLMNGREVLLVFGRG